MSSPLGTSFVYLVCSILLFLGVQRWVFREIQAVFLLLTRKPTTALGFLSILLFPGVFIHELSHYLMARILGVRTGRFSLLPKVLANGNLRLGYVETAAVDPLRDTLIGAAPLIVGMTIVAFVGINPLGIVPATDLVFDGNWSGFWHAVRILPNRPDFWLWFYLAFAVSSTMVPSAADRRAWWSVLLIIGLLFLAALMPGMSDWMQENITPTLVQTMKTLAVLFAACGVIHLTLVPPFILLRIAISMITGLRVV